MKYFLLLSAAATIICSTAYAQPGSLDPRFGNEGIVQTQYWNAYERPRLKTQKDGKLLTCIYAYPDTLRLYRFHPDGSPDLDFANNGVSATNQFYGASSIGLQTDGKILVGGTRNLPNGEFFEQRIVLRRFLVNGTIDSTFGENGSIETTLGGLQQSVNDLILQDDGKILITGIFSESGSRSDIFVARFMSDGSVDSSFGDEFGLTRILFNYGNCKITFQKDGKIILAGSSEGEYSNTSRFLLARLNTDGIIDNSFGEAGTGIVKTDYDLDGDFIRDIVVQSDDKMVVVGTALVGGFGNKIPYMAIARYLQNGVLDPSFGESGKVKLKLAERTDGYAVSLQTNDKIVVCGSTSYTNTNHVLARYLSDGSPDSSFGENGIVELDLGSIHEVAYDMVILSTGRIVVRGTPSITLLGFEGDKPSFITKIRRWIHRNILNFTDVNGTATEYNIEQQNSAGSFATIASLLPNKNNSYSYNISNYTSATANRNFRIKAVYADGSSVYSDVVTEAALQSSIKPSVYPNPAASVITINGLDKSKKYSIIISNKEAQPLLQTAAKSVTQKQIDIAMLKAGIYFIELKNDGGGVVRLKLVKE